jgi:DNA-binding MarR family transcriptional regulator
VEYEKNNTREARKEPELIQVYHEDPALRTFILLIQTIRLVSKYVDTCLSRKAGISKIKFIALLAFCFDGHSNDSITASQLARWTDTEPHNITTLIKRMKADGLLYAERDLKDRRYTNIKITNKGKKITHLSLSAAQEIVDQVMSSIDQDNCSQLEEMLTIIRQNAKDGLRDLVDDN